MTSGRWQDLYQSNQEAIRRSMTDGGAAPPAPAGRTLPTLRRASRPSAPPAEPPAADRKAGVRRVFRGPAGSRPYSLHAPPGRNENVPLVVVLHGCTQDAEAIAAGTRWNALADAQGFAVVYPEQTPGANRNGCWNWFLPEHQGREAGEPAILAGITREVLAGDEVAIDPGRVYVAGMSAGAGMATLLAATHPDLIGGVGVHSGVAYQAAANVSGAFAVMRNGVGDPLGCARAAYAGMGPRARVVPAVVLHGAADRTVAPVNGEQVTRQWLETNRLAGGGSFRLDPASPDRQRTSRAPGGYRYSVRGWDDGARPVVEFWQVEGLGHAWSGGSRAGSFTDLSGPDATAAMWSFFAKQPRA